MPSEGQTSHYAMPIEFLTEVFRAICPLVKMEKQKSVFLTV